MSRPDQYFPDGFRHGNELPDDQELDEMIYPERRPPPDNSFGMLIGMTYEECEQEKERREHAQHHRNMEEDRRFEITEGNVTGRKTGPPRTP